MGFTLEGLREAIKYMVESQGFDRVLSKMKLLSATPGKIVCEMKVEEEHTNRFGTLHGGLTATLVDVVSTAALLYTERAQPGVSVDMNITYTSAAKIGEDVLITAQILKQGRNIAFATVDLTNKTTGKLIAQGNSRGREQMRNWIQNVPKDSEHSQLCVLEQLCPCETVPVQLTMTSFKAGCLRNLL